jgi:uncharacterized protein
MFQTMTEFLNTILVFALSFLPVSHLPPVEAVTFTSGETTLSATLRRPENTPADARLPLVVVTGAWTSVKEQMPDTYARALTARGYATLTFDFRGWGLSGDLPGGVRYKEDPSAKIADIEAALDYAATLDGIDPDRIHALGICASAGYMLDATRGNDLVRSVGLVAPWLQDTAIVETVYG